MRRAEESTRRRGSESGERHGGTRADWEAADDEDERHEEAVEQVKGDEDGRYRYSTGKQSEDSSHIVGGYTMGRQSEETAGGAATMEISGNVDSVGKYEL